MVYVINNQLVLLVELIFKLITNKFHHPRIKNLMFSSRPNFSIKTHHAWLAKSILRNNFKAWLQEYPNQQICKGSEIMIHCMNQVHFIKQLKQSIIKSSKHLKEKMQIELTIVYGILLFYCIFKDFICPELGSNQFKNKIQNILNLPFIIQLYYNSKSLPSICILIMLFHFFFNENILSLQQSFSIQNFLRIETALIQPILTGNFALLQVDVKILRLIFKLQLLVLTIYIMPEYFIDIIIIRRTQNMSQFNLFDQDIFKISQPPCLNNTLLLIETNRYFPVHSTVSLGNNITEKEEFQFDSELSLQIKLKQAHHQTISSASTIKKKKAGCTCKKTKCLKMYCQCFSSGKLCTPQCCCYDCSNDHNHLDSVNKKKSMIKMKNLPKGKQSQGCNCKRSQCQKKYCECFNAGMACGQSCKCQECANGQCQGDIYKHIEEQKEEEILNFT